MTDDDCILHPDYFEQLIRAFAAQPAPVVIGGRILLGDPADLPVTVKLEDHPMIAPSDGFPGGFVMGANLAFTADVRDKVGLFDERFGAGAPFRAAEDTDYLFRALGHGIPVRYDPNFVVDHHHGRKPQKIVTLLAGYGYGDGAVYAKHLLSDRRIRAGDGAGLWPIFATGSRGPCRPSDISTPFACATSGGHGRLWSSGDPLAATPRHGGPFVSAAELKARPRLF